MIEIVVTPVITTLLAIYAAVLSTAGGTAVSADTGYMGGAAPDIPADLPALTN